ncbi:MAG: hypothetical protein R3C45_09005 [Phycisphaerales bacterium]
MGIRKSLIRLTFKRMGDKGLEPATENPAKTAKSDSSGAEYGAQPSPLTITDPELARVVGVWAHLPEAVRRGIVAMVNAGWDERQGHKK